MIQKCVPRVDTPLLPLVQKHPQEHRSQRLDRASDILQRRRQSNREARFHMRFEQHRSTLIPGHEHSELLLAHFRAEYGV
jgi:hypothetical protein